MKPKTDRNHEISDPSIRSGLGCSKLTKSLINETLKFEMLISEIQQYFC